MAKPLSKLRKKICTVIHNNGGWYGQALYCNLEAGRIEFYNRVGFYMRDSAIKTDIKESNQASRNEVTFTQYQQFLAEQEYPQAVEPEEDEPIKPIGLETLLSAWKAANEVITEQEEKLATAKQVADDAHKAVQNALSAFGWGKPSVTITDAKDLLPGDVIRCIGESWETCNQGENRIVKRVIEHDKSIHIVGRDFGFEFEFVERPELA